MTEEIMGALELKKPNGSEALAVTSPTPMDLMSQALQHGVSAEQLQILQEMHFRQLDREAKQAFLDAKGRFKKIAPTIRKTRPVTYDKGPNAKPAFFFAPLEEICPAIIDKLNEVGLTHRWRSDPPINANWIRVVCVLTHELGYSEEFGMEAPSDTSGGKNPIQAVISATSYLERVTLLGVCGLAAQGMDTDGIPSEDKANTIPDEQYVKLRDSIQNANNDGELKRLYRHACAEADRIGDQTSKRQFLEFKNERYRKLHVNNR